MYNKQFQLDISATSPFAYEKDDQPFIGITIVGTVRTTDVHFLDDLKLGDGQGKLFSTVADGLHAFLRGEIPIVGLVPVEFVQDGGLTLDFPEVDTLGCELTSVETERLGDGGLLIVKLKIKVPDLDGKDAGTIVSHLKQLVNITITKPAK